MRKGILLEVAGRHGVVLTPEGEFKRVRVPPAARVGEEVAYAAAARPGLGWWLAAAAAVILAVAGLPLMRGSLAVTQTVALVNLDINPSLEFAIDGGDRVLSGRALNQDGEVILAELSYRRQPLAAVVRQATELAIGKGYLRPADAEGTVLVTVTAVQPAAGATVTAGADLTAAVQDQVLVSVREVLGKYGAEAKAYGLEASTADRQSAQELQMPVAKYLIYKAALVMEPTLKPQDVLNLPPGKVKQLVRNAGLDDLVRLAHDQHAGQVAGKGDDRDLRPAGKGSSGGDPDRKDAPGKGSPPGGKDDGPGNAGRGQGQGDGQSQGKGQGAGGQQRDRDGDEAQTARAEDRPGQGAAESGQPRSPGDGGKPTGGVTDAGRDQQDAAKPALRLDIAGGQDLKGKKPKDECREDEVKIAGGKSGKVKDKLVPGPEPPCDPSADQKDKASPGNPDRRLPSPDPGRGRPVLPIQPAPLR